MKIRKIRQDDIGGIVRIMHKIMGPKDAKIALDDIKETISEKKNSPFKFEEFFVIEISGEIAAAGGVWALKHDPNVARLDWFVVDPSQQRKGLGTMLLRRMEQFTKKKGAKLIIAETSSGNVYKAAVNFWSKNGFSEIAKIANYWEDGSACLYFIKRL